MPLKDPVARKAYDIARNVVRKEKHNAFIREYQRRPEIKLRRRINDVLKHYHMTHEQHIALLEKQSYRCAFPHCGAAVSVNSSIDHDHGCCPKTGPQSTSCGKCVRGILCETHNVGLGYFDKLSPECLLDAYVYLIGKEVNP
jgi:hypothetical protein